MREKRWEWYRDDFSARLKPGAKRILMNTRWHEEDVAGRVLEQIKQGVVRGRVISIPANDDVLGADGERKYDELEKRLAAAPTISVPTITLEGDANGAWHPAPGSYANKFTGRYQHRNSTGGSGTTCLRRIRRLSSMPSLMPRLLTVSPASTSWRPAVCASSGLQRWPRVSPAVTP